MLLTVPSFALGITNQKTIQIPLESKDWIAVAYSKIPKNEVIFDKSRLIVSVNKSASPLVFKFENSKNILGFLINSEFFGLKKTELSDFDEDSVLRIGFVVPGVKTLSGVKKLFAPDWIKKLFSLAPKDSGIDRIVFFNLSDRMGILNKQRVHPNSDLIQEHIVQIFDSQNAKPLNDGENHKVDFSFKFSQPLTASALWLSIDGDNTKSEFKTSILKIEITESGNF